MARVKLELPAEFIFNTELNIRISEINYGGHMGNDAVLSLIHEARYRFLKHLGYVNETRVANETGIVVADSVIIYRAEGFHGDILEIHVAAYDFNNYGMDLFYFLRNRETGMEIARAKTGIVCVDHIKKKITKIPEEFIERISNLEAYTI